MNGRPVRTAFFRSPLRGPWLTAALGSMLLVLRRDRAATGFLSHIAYEPDLRGNAIVPAARDLPLTFGWPTGPAWLYAVNQSLHVNVGLVAVPFLLAKLWSVIPRLFVLAAGRVAGAGDRAAGDRAARRERDLPVRDRRS